MPSQFSGHHCDPPICLKLSRLELVSFSLFIVNLLKSQRMLPVTIFSIETSSFPGKSDFFFPEWELFPYISDGEESPLTKRRSKSSYDWRGKDVIDHSYTVGHKADPHAYRDPCIHVNNPTRYLLTMNNTYCTPGCVFNPSNNLKKLALWFMHIKLWIKEMIYNSHT